MKKILITGGSGFIGTNLINLFISKKNYSILNIDKYTYASNRYLENLKLSKKVYRHVKIDICNYNELKKIIKSFKPDKIIHLAAESHVDNSISGSKQFIQTNIIGTYNLLEISRLYLLNHKQSQKKGFVFHHISTDEVFGDLKIKDKPFKETNRYLPSSPYSASKASSDHLVKAWHRTYKLPIIITNCSNNFGPFQHHEKLIPKTILNALKGKTIPIYGNGEQIRDWLFVKDHVDALLRVLERGKRGETYNIGGNSEIKNINVVKEILNYLDHLIKIKPKGLKSFKSLITFVKDRPGHDLRYAINISKIKKELDWKPKTSFREGIKLTVDWYLKHYS